MVRKEFSSRSKSRISILFVFCPSANPHVFIPPSLAQTISIEFQKIKISSLHRAASTQNDKECLEKEVSSIKKNIQRWKILREKIKLQYFYPLLMNTIKTLLYWLHNLFPSKRFRLKRSGDISWIIKWSSHKISHHIYTHAHLKWSLLSSIFQNSRTRGT